MNDKIETRVVSLFVLMLAILVYVAISAVRNIERSIAGSDWVNHTHAVIIEANAVLSSLHAGDSALRNFLLTGDKRDQGAYRTAYSELVEHLEVGKALTKTEEEQHKLFLQIESLIADRVNFTRSVIHAREQDGLDGARKVLAAHPDGESIGEIERAVQKLTGEENALLRERDKAANLQAQSTKWTLEAGVVINFILLVFVSWLMRDDLTARRMAATALQQANAQLETKVQERTSDLVKANRSLKEENLERRWSNQALDHQLRYSQLIINSIGELVFVISNALNISRINPAVLHQTNFEANEVIAKSIDRVLQVPAEGAAQNPIIIALKEGHEIQGRPAVLLCRGGRTVNVNYSLVPLRDQDKVVGGVVTVRPVQDGAQQGASTISKQA